MKLIKIGWQCPCCGEHYKDEQKNDECMICTDLEERGEMQ